jgi:hypothetical protein
VAASILPLQQALDHTRTGDLWLFRGSSAADRAIRLATNAPVNHVGMAVVLDDLPPLMWHAEMGKGLLDIWAGKHHRGVQLHDLHDAVRQWHDRYGQQAWIRQIAPEVTRPMEDALLRTVAQMDGTPFPSTAGLASRWVRGRVRRQASLETIYCAELVATSYEAMGLLPPELPENAYDPGSFWSGDRLRLLGGYRMSEEVAVLVPPPPGGQPSEQAGRRARATASLRPRVPSSVPDPLGVGFSSRPTARWWQERRQRWREWVLGR